jgi:hypothetical protein
MLLLALVGSACSSSAPGFEAKAPGVKAPRRPDGSIDDRSMCAWRGRKDLEASETAGPGAFQPNVRRVFQIIGTGEERTKVLVCREIDTNFDGVKDVVRRYNDKGESLHEEADANYDGRIERAAGAGEAGHEPRQQARCLGDLPRGPAGADGHRRGRG